MIPLVAHLRIGRRTHRSIGLWIPLILVWLLLLPIVFVLLPLFIIGCAVGQMNPFRVLSAFWGILSGLHNTHLEVEDHSSSVLLDIY